MLMCAGGVLARTGGHAHAWGERQNMSKTAAKPQ